MAELFFDATTVDPAGTFEVLPKGDYPCIIADSSMERTKDGTGQFLKLTLSVIDGPHQGATLFDRLNLVNNSQRAAEIAYRVLSSICHAIGVLHVQDSTQLHNRPLIVRVELDQGGRPDGKGGTYGPSNQVKGYKPMTQAQAPSAPAQQAAPPQPAWTPQPPAPMNPPAQWQPASAAPPAQASSVPPWMQNKAAAA